MKIKLLALDLDDTTLAEGGVLTDFNKEALLKAIEHNIEVVVASGRNYTSLPSCITELPGIRYAIVSNGAAIYDIKADTRIAGAFLPADAVKTVMDLEEQEENSSGEIVIDSIAYAPCDYINEPLKFSPDTLSPHIIEYLKNTRKPVENFYGFAMENAHRIDSINLTFKNSEQRKAFQAKLEKLTDDVYLTSSIGHLLEISCKTSGKGNAMRTLCKMLEIPLSETAACGNADNDTDMVAAAKIGAAVENATDSCKAAADVIIPHHNDNGVGKFIYSLISGQ